MKTIKERANEYAVKENNNYDRNIGMATYNDFIAGANSERAELTRWNDPKEVLPEQQRDVVVKYKYNCYGVCYAIGHYDGKWNTECGIIAVGTVLGWRPIHE